LQEFELIFGASKCASEESHIMHHEEPPESLRCPITNKLMNEPVMATDGFTYDRTSITDWIELNCTSPKTGEKVSSGLIPNYEKKAQIDQWNEKQLKRMRGSCDIEPLLARVAWASSSDEACTELTNLSSIIAQNQLLIPEHKLRRMRLCLSSDENVWCPRVAQLLDSLEPPSAAPNNSNTTHKQKKQTMTSAARADRAEEEELKRVQVVNSQSAIQGECALTLLGSTSGNHLLLRVISCEKHPPSFSCYCQGFHFR
jgi:hypothetical protein